VQQRSFGSVEYEHKKVKTRRQAFLERMDGLVPWAELEQRIAPVYPKPGRGRRPYPLRVMLRIHCLQLWFNLSDPGMEQELYDSRSMLEFADLSLSEPIPDETTILHFRHLLERHQLGTELFATINAHLARQGRLAGLVTRSSRRRRWSCLVRLRRAQRRRECRDGGRRALEIRDAKGRGAREART